MLDLRAPLSYPLYSTDATCGSDAVSAVSERNISPWMPCLWCLADGQVWTQVACRVSPYSGHYSHRHSRRLASYFMLLVLSNSDAAGEGEFRCAWQSSLAHRPDDGWEVWLETWEVWLEASVEPSRDMKKKKGEERTV